MNEAAGRVKVSWGFAAVIGVFLFLCYLLTVPGSVGPSVSDGRAMYMVTQSIVDRHQLGIVPNRAGEVVVAPNWRPWPLPTGACATEPAVDGVGERPSGPFYAKYGIGQSLLAVPLYTLGIAASRSFPMSAHGIPGIDQAEVRQLVTSAYDSLITALTAAILAALATRLGWSRRIALGLALLFGLATPAWAYTTTFFSEPTIGLCLIGALAALLWSKDGPTPLAGGVAGAWLCVAMLTHLADSALYAAVFGVYLLLSARRRGQWASVGAFAAPLVFALLVTAWYNQARFGSVMNTGYGIVGDHHDLNPPHTWRGLWEGVYGLLFSPGKGIFLYAPILFGSAWAWPRFVQKSRAGAWLCLGLVLMAVAGHANTLIVWLGGWAWGPRFMIPVLPVAVLPLGAWLAEGGRWARSVAWILGSLGVIIQIPAVLLNYGVYIDHLRNEVPDRCIWTAEELYKWQPRYSPLIGQWQRLFDPVTYNMPFRLDASLITMGRYSSEPQTWWRLLSEQGVSLWQTAIVAIIIGAAALFALALVLFMARVDTGDAENSTFMGRYVP